MYTIPFNLELQERVAITPAKLSEFCQRRQIKELALFGSVLRDDFHANSDIDMLVTFQPNAKVSLLDLVDMQYELEDLCHRKVDLLTKKSVETSPNWIRRKEILSTARVIYES
ncbi:MAG: nucleotidyltransferase family protein [Hydrococcus sp. C42_A2020_068]|uniref:nucleotidyltransferase family protein n=1 Tax=Leptodesmis sichuanensis TaxID=2906798 RepID=UPI0019FE76A3|nr:nucleotidyltransferase family protein [Leptodesmis sichuanensis]MBF2003183.1 nucleotidyltransferase family protein [Synechococcales cyanobacterium M58_A2018_015]MBF2021964.1 nucleotidyltransferase family protein [Hydrococcus sp. C42_A2020_068]UIE40136.1 nucleotidyltransferase family protein [Leptodesmis sichuanensis A121]